MEHMAGHSSPLPGLALYCRCEERSDEAISAG